MFKVTRAYAQIKRPRLGIPKSALASGIALSPACANKGLWGLQVVLREDSIGNVIDRLARSEMGPTK